MAANSSEHRCTKEMKGKERNVHVYECTLHTGAKNEGKGGKRVGGGENSLEVNGGGGGGVSRDKLYHYY